MTFDNYLGYVPAGFYDALGEMFKAAAAGFIVAVGVWLIACLIRVGFDVMRSGVD